MKHLFFILLLSILFPNLTKSQDIDMNKIPYHEIANYPENYAPGNVMARFIDGLGYRFYWASEGLEESDLAYKPSEEARSCMETISHIYDLSVSILNTSQGKVNLRPAEKHYSTYLELRTQTLLNLASASKFFADKTEADLAVMKIMNESPKGNSEFQLWNLMNGQISDAIYHTGQLVTFRRPTGNPMNPKVSVFMGKNRN